MTAPDPTPPRVSDEEVERLIDLIGDALGFAYWGASQGISAAQEAPMPEDFLSEYTEATGDEDWETLSHRVPAMARSLLAERRALESDFRTAREAWELETENRIAAEAQVAALLAERRTMNAHIAGLAAQVGALSAAFGARASVIGETRRRALEEAEKAVWDAFANVWHTEAEIARYKAMQALAALRSSAPEELNHG